MVIANELNGFIYIYIYIHIYIFISRANDISLHKCATSPAAGKWRELGAGKIVIITRIAACCCVLKQKVSNYILLNL